MIELRPLAPSDREQFIKDNQEAFNYGALEEFGRRDDHFEEEDAVSGKNEFQYLTVKNGNMDEGHFYLFTTGNMAHMLKKDCFIVGDPEKFADFIKHRAAVILDPVE